MIESYPLTQSTETTPAPAPATTPSIHVPGPTRFQRWMLYLAPVGLSIAVLLLANVLISVSSVQEGASIRILSAAVAVAVGLLAYQRLRNEQFLARWQATNDAMLHALHELSTATLVDRGSDARVLGRLVRLFADALEMKTSILHSYDPQRDEMVITEHHGLTWELGGDRFPLSALPITRKCFEQQSVYVIEDGHRNRGMFPPGFLEQRNVRSFLLIPLMVKGKPLGVIQLADPQPYRVGPTEQSMAELWARQAAILIAHRRLHQRLRRTAQRRRLLLRQTRRLYQLTEGMYHATTLAESLQHACELGPRVFGVRQCIVLLRQAPGTNILRIAGCAKDDAQHPLESVVDATGTSAAAAMLMRKPVWATDEDGRNSSLFPCPIGASVLYAPLCTNVASAAIGVIVLMRKRRGGFRPREIRLAESFASQAASAIENARLLEQTTRDAQTKKQLLRELNHRVKNNLAGIVGLLSTCPATASVETRSWVERIGLRIAAMGRAHQLFMDGAVGVRLGDLIRQIVDSTLTPMATPITRWFDLSAGDVQLDADRALALAMVLHELCHNATVYALKEGGSLAIRASRTGDGSLSIAVEDQPAIICQRSEPSGSPGGSGIGLELVRALVQRELRGEFMLRQSDRGMSAEIRLPLDNHRNEDGTTDHAKSYNGTGIAPDSIDRTVG